VARQGERGVLAHGLIAAEAVLLLQLPVHQPELLLGAERSDRGVPAHYRQPSLQIKHRAGQMDRLHRNQVELTQAQVTA
jgi:hypothetical protein